MVKLKKDGDDMINKKVYFIGISITFILMILRIFFVIGDYSTWDIIWLVIKTAIFTHLFCLLGFLLMKIQRLIYTELFVGIRIFLIWTGFLFFTVYYLFGYITEINNNSLDYSQINSVIMLSIGALIENLFESNKKQEERIKRNRLPKDVYEEKLLSGRKRY